mmetsp:Transcript_96568/g.133907  ORF Transcript_96568/g.133907 Transcript_96568/m.133907 type:complete len:146 (+) Transcript_96568:395-832(+)
MSIPLDPLLRAALPCSAAFPLAAAAAAGVVGGLLLPKPFPMQAEPCTSALCPPAQAAFAPCRCSPVLASSAGSDLPGTAPRSVDGAPGAEPAEPAQPAEPGPGRARELGSEASGFETRQSRTCHMQLQARLDAKILLCSFGIQQI